MATYYAINAGGNWTAGGTWSTTSAKDATRVGGVTAPTNADTCYLDDYSGNVTINAASVCLTIDENGNGAYGGTLAFGTQTLTVSGLATLRGAMTSTSGTLSVAGGVTIVAAVTGTFPLLIITGASTLTSNSLNPTWGGALTFNINGIVVLLGNWINTGLVTNSTTTLTLNYTTNETLTCNGGLQVNGFTAGGGTTATIIIGGTGGTWSSSGNVLKNNLTFNCTTAIISPSQTVYYQTGTMTYIAGTITTTSSNLTLYGSCTLATRLVPDTGGIIWNNISLGNINPTITLTSNLACTGTFDTTILSPTFSGAYNISLGILKFRPPTASKTIILVAGQTLTITSGMIVSGDGGTVLATIKAPSTSVTYLNYTGTVANCKVFAATFTYVDASGSSQGIDNWYGGTLSNTVNIVNRTSADIKTTGGWGAGTVTQYTGVLARGGSGSAVLLNPSSTIDKLIWTFLVPTTAATPFTLKFWHMITASYNGSMKITVYDTDNTTKLLTQNSVTFTDDAAYHQYSAGALTPTATGFCRILCEILNGVVTGDIYVDDATST